MDRAYEDLLSDRISDEFWTRRSTEWEIEVATIDGELSRLERQNGSAVAKAEKILELAKKGEISLQIAESGRTASTVRNGAIELHLRPRKSQAYIHFAVRPAGERKRNWKLAERVGFEPDRIL